MRIKLGYVLVFVFLLAAVAAAPWIDGLLIKRNYQDVLIAISNGNSAKTKVLEYHVGWFNSRAIISVEEIPIASTTDLHPANAFILEQKISHGPILYDTTRNKWVLALAEIQSDVRLPKKLEESLLDGQSNYVILQMNTLVNFHRNFLSTVRMPATKFKLSDKLHLVTQGFDGTVSADVVNHQLSYIKTEMSGSSFSIQDPTGMLVVDGVSSQGVRTCQPTGLCSGSATIAIKGVSGNDSSGFSLKVTDIKATSTYGVDANNLMNGALQLSLGKWVTPAYVVGPSTIQFSSSHLNGDELIKLIEVTKNARTNQDMQDVAVRNLYLLGQYNALLPHLITQSTVISSDSAIETSFGNFMANAKINWPENTALPTSTADLITKMHFNMTARAATTLIDHMINLMDVMAAQHVAHVAPAMVPPQHMTLREKMNALVKQGFITQEDKDYVVTVNYEQGVMKVNNIEIPMAGMASPSPVNE